MNYELDWDRPSLEKSNAWFIGVLTGLPDDEIFEACPNKELWGGQAFVKTFKKLGFNTSERFEKFDPETDKPCIMRTVSYQKGKWFAWIYYNGLVDNTYTLAQFREKWPRLRITSMLQVWI